MRSISSRSRIVALGQQALVGALVVQVGLHFLAAQDVFQALQALVGQNSDFVRKVLFQLRDLRAFDELGALVLFLALAREDLHVDDDALDARRAVERSVAHVAGFFAEDGAQQLFFRRELGLALRRDLAHEDVALLDAGADADHARFVQIAQHGFADVGNIARDFFRTQLGVARFDLELLDVQRGVVILFHHLLGDQNRVFKVVTAPRHEGDQDVSSQRQLAVIGAGTVGNDLALDHALALFDHRLLVDAGVLVRALELGELVNVAAHLTRQLRGMMLAFDAHDDALGVDRIDEAVALGQNHSAGVAGSDAFHSRADDRRLRAEQRHGLALHVRAHQCAVGVVVLEERHQRCGDRNQLLRADVDVIDFVAADQNKVAGLAGVDQFGDDACPCRRVRRWPARWCGDPLPTRKDRRRTARSAPASFACLSSRR